MTDRFSTRGGRGVSFSGLDEQRLPSRPSQFADRAPSAQGFDLKLCVFVAGNREVDA